MDMLESWGGWPLELASFPGQARLKRARSRNPAAHVPATPIAATPIASRPAVKHAVLLAAVIGFTFLAYANSLRAPLIPDNDEIVLKDPRVHAVTPVQLHRILTQQYWETASTGAACAIMELR